MKKGAEISQCERYRYRLWRIWDKRKPAMLWVMHNPSTADGDQDDPTIRRCIGFAKSWGYGGIYVGNISPYRATDPKELRGLSYRELMGYPWNYEHLEKLVKRTAFHVLAYGVLAERAMDLHVLPDANWYCLGTTKDGHPKHPLYVPADTVAVPFIEQEGGGHE